MDVYTRDVNIYPRELHFQHRDSPPSSPIIYERLEIPEEEARIYTVYRFPATAIAQFSVMKLLSTTTIGLFTTPFVGATLSPAKSLSTASLVIITLVTFTKS